MKPRVLIFVSVLFVPLILNFSTRELFEFPKMIAVYLLALLALFFLAIGNRPAGNRSKLALPLGLFLLTNLIATLLSIDRLTSLFGYYSRFNGGLLSLLSFLALYFFAQRTLEKEGIAETLFYLTLGATVSGAYGVLQHFGIDKNFWVQDSAARVFSTLGQPNWLAAYLLMTLPISFYLFLEAESRRAQSFYLVSSLIQFSGIWFTYSLSGFLGLAFLVPTLYLTLDKRWLGAKRRRIMSLTLLCLAVIVFNPGLFGRRIFSAYKNLTRVPVGYASEKPEPALPANNTDTTAIRLIVWRGGLNLFFSSPKTFLFGTGPETFAYAFLPFRPQELNKTTEWDFLYNKSHNAYLDTLTGSGLFGFASFGWLVFNVSRLYKRRRRTDAGLAAVLISGWLSLLVTNFFGWPTVSTSLLFFLYPAFIENLEKNPGGKIERPKNKSNWSKKVASGLLLIIGLKSAVNLYLADTSFVKALSFSSRAEFEEAHFFFREALRRNSLEAAYHREFSRSLAEAALDKEAVGKKELLAEAEEEGERAYRLNQRNSLTLKSSLRTDYLLAKADPKFKKNVLTDAERIGELSPTEPRPFYEIALILANLGERRLAADYAAKALQLKPDYADPKVFLEELKSSELELKER